MIPPPPPCFQARSKGVGNSKRGFAVQPQHLYLILQRGLPKRTRSAKLGIEHHQPDIKASTALQKCRSSRFGAEVGDHDDRPFKSPR